MRRAVWAVGLVLAALLLTGAKGCGEPANKPGDPACVNEQNERVPCPENWESAPTPLPRPYGVPERIWQ